jgi:predicted phosphodiesterase
MIAAISDIHANLEALRIVMDRIRECSAIYCAGDIVGYGPNPNECCELLRECRARAVLGNHDIVCAHYDRLVDTDPSRLTRREKLARTTLSQMNSVARESCAWTHRVLTDENLDYLRGLPLVLREGKISVIHGSPGSDYHKLNTYLQEKYETLSSQRRAYGMGFTEFCGELLDEMETMILIVGHTHIPYKGYVYRGGRWNWLPRFLTRENWVINPGAVGQPRRGKEATFALIKLPLFPYLHPRASFRFLEHYVQQCEVSYDRRETIRKINAIEDLEEPVRFMLSNWF